MHKEEHHIACIGNASGVFSHLQQRKVSRDIRSGRPEFREAIPNIESAVFLLRQ